MLGTAGDLDGVAALVGPGGGQFTGEDFKRLRFDEAQEVLGSALLRAAKACADADSLPLDLLTCQPRNLRLYKRHGFGVVCEIDKPDTAVQWWGMRRPPQD